MKYSEGAARVEGNIKWNYPFQGQSRGEYEVELPSDDDATSFPGPFWS